MCFFLFVCRCLFLCVRLYMCGCPRARLFVCFKLIFRFVSLFFLTGIYWILLYFDIHCRKAYLMAKIATYSPSVLKVSFRTKV